MAKKPKDYICAFITTLKITYKDYLITQNVCSHRLETVKYSKLFNINVGYILQFGIFQ